MDLTTVLNVKVAPVTVSDSGAAKTVAIWGYGYRLEPIRGLSTEVKDEALGVLLPIPRAPKSPYKILRPLFRYCCFSIKF